LPSETANVARAKCMPFLEKLENDTLQFPKKLKKNLDVDNDVFYRYAKPQLRTPCILGQIKITRSNILEVLNFAMFTIQSSTFVIFLHCLEYKVFQVKILHIYRIHRYLHLGFFTDIF
jgi:hypothetical protein